MTEQPAIRLSFSRLFSIIIAGCLLGSTSTAVAAPAAEIGQTRIARWHDDKIACFLLMFDDSWPSHWQVAAPELVKRGLIATFYINPGKCEYKKFAAKWEQELWRQGMVYGNHTMTHKGVKDLEDAEREIGDCAKVILKMVPGKETRLISYAQPGVAAGAWNISPAQLEQLLAKHHLITRDEIQGRMTIYHLKTIDEMLALADKAIAAKGVDFIVIHGVERTVPDWGYQDMWPLKQNIFLPLHDGLKARQDKGELWITDHISSHQYATERDTATVKVLQANNDRIRLELTCAADPTLYDLPLTLITRVPAAWRAAKARQGERVETVAVRDGEVRFRALPGGGPITLTPALPPATQKTKPG